MSGIDDITETPRVDRHGVLIDGSSTYYEANGTGCEEPLPASIAGLLAPREAVVIMFDKGLEKYS